MHPEIVRDGPGSCPICGMALEPMIVSLQPGKENGRELHDMTRRLWVAASLSAPLLVIAMAELLPAAWRNEVELALATPVCVWAAWPFFKRAAQSVRNVSPNMFTLVGLGVSVAYLYSVVGTVAPVIWRTASARLSMCWTLRVVWTSMPASSSSTTSW